MKAKPNAHALVRGALLMLAFVLVMTMATVVMADDYAPYSAGPHIAVTPPDDPSAAPSAPYTEEYAPYEVGPHIPVSPPDAPYASYTESYDAPYSVGPHIPVSPPHAP